MPRYASSTDVARLAGVSQSAVSRTYKPGGSVSAETRRKVLAAAEQLGYRPSLIPQIMLNHRSYLVAIVIGGMYNPFYAKVLEEFTVKLQAIGHQVLLVHVDSDHSLDADHPAPGELPRRRHRQRPRDPVAARRRRAGAIQDPGDHVQHPGQE